MNSISLQDLTRTALRSWWTIVAGICLGLAGAVVALDRIPPRFEATATIEVPESVAGTHAPAEMSQRPVAYSPESMQVYAVFLVLGCLLFSGPVLARGLLRPVISSESGFGALSELPVLVSIPAADLEQSRRSTRRRLAKNVTLSMLSCAVLVGALVFTSMG